LKSERSGGREKGNRASHDSLAKAIPSSQSPDYKLAYKSSFLSGSAITCAFFTTPYRASLLAPTSAKPPPSTGAELRAPNLSIRSACCTSSRSAQSSSHPRFLSLCTVFLSRVPGLDVARPLLHKAQATKGNRARFKRTIKTRLFRRAVPVAIIAESHQLLDGTVLLSGTATKRCRGGWRKFGGRTF